MQDLSVLTPPLLMAAVVVFAVVAFLRHELGKKHPEDSDASDDIPDAPPISDDQGGDQAAGAGSSRSDQEG